MKLFGLAISEWASVLAVLTVVFGFLAWVGKWVYKAVKEDIAEPLKQAMSSLERSIDGLSNNVNSETRWIHERHSEVVKQLNNHEEQLDQHTIEIAQHEERLRTLCEDRKKGYK